MKYLKPEEILNNPNFAPVVPNPYVYGLSNMNKITHYTRVSSGNEGWEKVLYYRVIRSIKQDQPKIAEGIA